MSVALRSRERPFWQAHDYDFNVTAHEKFAEKLRYVHRNPLARGLVEKPEDWKWSSYCHYQTGTRGTVEIEWEWTARQRGWQLPEWMRDRDTASPVPKGEGRGAPLLGVWEGDRIEATGRSPVPKGEGPGTPLLGVWEG